jgi:isomaltose glucohydrolase
VTSVCAASRWEVLAQLSDVTMTGTNRTMTNEGARELAAASLEVIAGGQHASGAYIAAPFYPPYAYAWLRDGGFCAYAMDLHGHPESARAFHSFVTRTVLAHRGLFDAANPALGDMPPARYTLEGRLEDNAGEMWPNFQLDGYGTWLWLLRDHERRGGTLVRDDRAAAEIVSRYLRGTATVPCFDCWEELGDRRHTSTLASVIAGLRAAAELLGEDAPSRAADSLRERLLRLHVSRGSFVKFEGSSAVDASLLWLALPFGVVDLHDPLMVRTAARVSDELVGPTGGVRRYLGDTFYGGGEWIVLTAWLAWYRAATGQRDPAARGLAWIEASATPGLLPEQRTEAAQYPGMVAPWVERWGPVATPLLWSHAMYLVLRADVDRP